MCSFYHEPLRTWIETNFNKLAISCHPALKLDLQALRSYLSLICEYELYILTNKKVSTAKDHGKNYIKDRPPLFRHLLRNCLFEYADAHYCITADMVNTDAHQDWEVFGSRKR